MTKMSKKHHNEIEIFIKQKTDYLLFHDSENFEIQLMKETTFSFIQNYKSMTVKKLNVVKKYLDEYLKKTLSVLASHLQ